MGRYNKIGDVMALQMEYFFRSSASGSACAGFFRPEDRMCDVIDHLKRKGAIHIPTGEKTSATCGISRSEYGGEVVFRQMTSLPYHASRGHRLAFALRELPGRAIFFSDAELLPPDQFRVLNRAISQLAKEGADKRIIALFQGDPIKFDALLQSFDRPWKIVRCPFMTNEDVKLCFLQQGITIEIESVLTKFRNFAHSAPLRIAQVVELAQKFRLKQISMETALELIAVSDSNGNLRPMEEPGAFSLVRKAKVRPKKSEKKKAQKKKAPVGNERDLFG